jgi:hypothetical protein
MRNADCGVVAATVRSGPEDLPDLKTPLKPLEANDQKPQSPSGMFATKRELGTRLPGTDGGLTPISANLRSLGLYSEDLSRLVRRSLEVAFFRFELRRGEGGRDSVKVAQYEVLGNDAKRQVRPGRDDRIAWRLVWHVAQRLPASLDRPVPPSSRRRSKGERGGLTTADRQGRIAL